MSRQYLRPRTTPIVRPRDHYIDETAIERVVRGRSPLPVLTAQEVREASRRLTNRGVSARIIAERVMVKQRTVHRWRAADRTAA